MTTNSALDAVLRQRAFSARIKNQFGAPGAEPSRNDLQLGKEEMISALHHRTHGQVAVLADNLQKLAAALARQEAAAAALAATATPSRRPSSARPGSPSRSTQFSLHASPRRPSPLRSPQRPPVPSRRLDPATPSQAQTPPQPPQPPRAWQQQQQEQQQQCSATAEPARGVQSGTSSASSGSPSHTTARASAPASGHLPSGASASSGASAAAPTTSSSAGAYDRNRPSSASPSTALDRNQPSSASPSTLQQQFDPGYWARVGRSRDHQDSLPPFGVQAKEYRLFQQYDFQQHAVKTVARPDTWRGDPLQSRGEERGRAQPATARRPFSAPVCSSSTPRDTRGGAGGRGGGGGRGLRSSGDADHLCGIVEEDPSSDVDPMLASAGLLQQSADRQQQGAASSTRSQGPSPFGQGTQGQRAPHAKLQGQQWRPHSAPVRSHPGLGFGAGAGTGVQAAGGAGGRPGSAAPWHHHPHVDPPARASSRGIPHATPKRRVASAHATSRARAASPLRGGPEASSGISPEQSISPRHLRPTKSFLYKCAPEAIPLLTAIGEAHSSTSSGSGLRSGSRPCSTTDLARLDGGVELQPLGAPKNSCGAGRAGDAGLSPPRSPARQSDSLKVPSTMLKTMLGAYENLYQYS